MGTVTLTVPDSARDVLSSHVPDAAIAASDVDWLVPPDRKKNFVVHFRRGDERFVLKVYRDSPGAFRQSLSNPVLRWVVGAYCLRATGLERARIELSSIAAYRAAGLDVLEVVATPAPHAIVFRYLEADSLHRLVERAEPAERAQWVRRMAEDLARRQEIALSRGERRLLHPHPRLTHVLVTPDGRLVHHDFEGLVNPSLDLASALGLEVECFLSFLGASKFTRDRAYLEAACDALGPAAIARWRAVHRKPLWFLSGSARNRRRRLGWLGHSDA